MCDLNKFERKTEADKLECQVYFEEKTLYAVNVV